MMTDLGELGVCDVCSAPSTDIAVDTRENTPPGESWTSYEVVGPIKRGCAAHPVRSIERPRDWQPGGTMPEPAPIRPQQAYDERFVYQAPTAEQLEILKVNREACRDLAFLIDGTPMDPRCKALAITALETVSMWCNKGIVFAP